MFNKPYPFYELSQISSLPDMVKQKAKKCPEGIPFAWYDIDEKHTVTYKLFSEEVCAAAQAIEESYGHCQNIGLIGENSYQWLVIFTAIIFSGNVVVVFDKDMVEEELLEVAGRMDIVVMMSDPICEKKARNVLGDARVQLFGNCLESKMKAKGLDSFEVKNPDAVCCIFLTSGTTGQRKGVMLSHRNIAADINGSCRLFELKGDTLAVLPFHHAFGLMVAVWMVFQYEHTVYISRGLRKMQKELILVAPQTMMLVPLFVETLHRQVKLASKNKAYSKNILERFGGKLEYIICGGAALDEYYIKEFRACGIEILNGYGTTECSPVVAVNRNYYHKDGTVGIPIPGSRVMISEDGEVLVFGEHVMTGYYKDPEETKKSFKGGWYCSGDLGEIDTDGFVKLTGRKKNLIVLSNGENIIPEELEEKLIRIEGVDEVVVSSVEGNLTAEIFSKNADESTKDLIQSRIDCLNRQLPMFKRITRIVFRNKEFPKTTSQKIRRLKNDGSC